MRNKLIVLAIALLFISGLSFLLYPRRVVDFSQELSAAEIMSAESFQAMTPYGVPEVHDTDTTLRKKPAIYWGRDTNGSVTYNDGTFQDAFNASCSPAVILAVERSDDTATSLYTSHITSINSTGFVYEVRESVNDAEADVTATVPVYWVAFGWK